MSELKAEIGIIGGTGVYELLELLEDVTEHKIYTPYGETSDFVTIGNFKGRRIAFIPRHGRRHRIPPHKINYRANIWALKSLGVTRILAPSAVGSLREGIAPGHIVVPDQFIDRTTSRVSTFYEGSQVCHISMADPFCPELRNVVINVGKELNYPIHERGTYVCIEGPRFSTRAESKLFRSWGADIIGMTLIPECVLAREAEICYVNIATVTDYDVWAEKPVTRKEVFETLEKNVEKTMKILANTIPRVPEERNCPCKEALKDAVG
ncbi:MAG: S-methyl-5'-thioadenosine phosphorylase [Nitrososphaerota archaeon]|nr:S-methyl-5'-thioadenosine phosphorylase [Nitrososphaerales archaeon]MDW8044733.1 S-methyl-5'-thioadenosine phosphorylase [Nitrososphaerota archaeon]